MGFISFVGLYFCLGGLSPPNPCLATSLGEREGKGERKTFRGPLPQTYTHISRTCQVAVNHWHVKQALMFLNLKSQTTDTFEYKYSFLKNVFVSNILL